MKTLNILVPMHLRGQEKAPFGRQHGYAMAALLIAMSIMAILMTVAMPVWQQISRREKEEELIFRGQQYARAIGLFGRKYANANPPTLDVLIEQHFLRKKYKDPITQDDFQTILAGQTMPGSTTQPATQGRAGPGQLAPARGGTAQPGQSQAGPPVNAGATGGVIGVVSKSPGRSIRIYNGRTHYNEWAFVYTAPVQAPGAGAPGTAAPGQRGQQGQPPGTGPAGRGAPPGRGAPNAPPRLGNPPFNPNPGNPGRGVGTFQPVEPAPEPGGRGR
jgi:type II secretory pathway pseudopilin PulG